LAPFSKEDKILIKSLYEYKGYNAGQFIAEFPDKGLLGTASTCCTWCWETAPCWQAVWRV